MFNPFGIFKYLVLTLNYIQAIRRSSEVYLVGNEPTTITKWLNYSSCSFKGNAILTGIDSQKKHKSYYRLHFTQNLFTFTR
jgi:hypothetical protein